MNWMLLTSCADMERFMDSASRRILFMDASGELDCLFLPPMCGIESAARSNADADIFVFVNRPKTFDLEAPVQLDPNFKPCQPLDMLQKLPNVRVIVDNMTAFYSQPEFHQLSERMWWAPGDLSELHFTNAARLVLLQKFGGVFLSSKTITLRSLKELPANFLSIDFDSDRDEKQVLAFEARHPFVSYALDYFSRHYVVINDQKPVQAAPLGEAFLNFCDTDSTASGIHVCQNETTVNLVELVPTLALPPALAQRFIKETAIEFDLASLKKNLIVHVDTVKLETPFTRSSVYSVLAQRHCPMSWRLYTEQALGPSL